MNNSLQIEILHEEEQFYELRNEWATLLSADSSSTAFQSWEFLYPHWKYRKSSSWKYNKSDRQLYLLTGRSEKGRLQVIAPFWRQRVTKGITLEIIEFIGTRGLDYLDFIVSSEVDKRDATTSVFAYLMSHWKDWDVISLAELRKDSKDIMVSVLNDLGVKCSQSPCSTCVRIDLPDNWEDYRKTLGRSTRKDINYDENRLEKAFDVNFLVYTNNSADLQSACTALHEIHQKRWIDAGKKGAFYEDWMKMLDSDIVMTSAEKGVLRYFTLYVNGYPVAGLSGFLSGNAVYTHTMTISNEENFRKFSIGNVLLQKSIRWAIENGYRYFDLSRGDEQYKFKFGGKADQSYRIEIFKNIIGKSLLNLGRKIYGVR